MNAADQSVLGLLLDPGRLIFGGWEYFTTWLWTRRWISAAFIALPVAVLVFLGVSAGVGQLRSREQMLLSYWKQIENEIERSSQLENSSLASATGTDVDEQDSKKGTEQSAVESNSGDKGAGSLEALASNQPISPYLEMLLLRVLDLDTSNVRATYWVARNLGLQGRQGQARWMMRRIAGEKTRGFAPAHAWLATDQLTALGGVSKSNPIEREQLLRDLGIACAWEGSNPQLTLILAELMAEGGKAAEGLRILEQVAEKEPRFWLQVADLADRYKRGEFFERSSTRLRAWMQPRFEAGIATLEDYLASAHLEHLEDDWDAAIAFSSRALQMEPANPVIRRVLSRAYLKKFQAAEDLGVRMDLLDAALKADGSNPDVTNEIARMLTTGQTAPHLVAALEEKLANGQASAVAHMLLANRKLTDQEYAEAIGHLEIAHKMLPTSYIVLNNLALAMARYQPDNSEVLQRAENLLLKALKLRNMQAQGPDAELFDSLGEVRARRNDHLGAIECFETSIGIDKDRSSTRTRLAASYRAVGLEDMARIQERMAQQNRIDVPAESSLEDEASAPVEQAVALPDAPTSPTMEQATEPAMVPVEESSPTSEQNANKETNEDAKASGGGESATPASGDGSSGK